MLKSQIIIPFFLLIFNSFFSFAMDYSGIRHRKGKQLSLVPTTATCTSLSESTSMDLLPDEVILLIVKLTNYDDKRSLCISRKKFYKLISETKLLMLPSTHPIYESLIALPTQTLIDTLVQGSPALAHIDWSELKASYKKMPASAVNTEQRDCDRYNKDEEKQIKYAFVFCKLSQLNNCISSRDYSQAKEILSKAKNPCTQGIPGQSGLMFGFLGGLGIGYQVFNHCGGGLFGLTAGAICGVAGFPAVAIPFLALERYYGNYSAHFSADDVGSLLSALEANESSPLSVVLAPSDETDSDSASE